ncbi:MAG: DUF2064 domain-containing protein [Salinirussus sp.]
MPTVALLADPPVEGVLPLLEEILPSGTAPALYAAMLVDVATAVQNGAGELLVNYRPDDQVEAAVDSRSRIASVLDEQLPRPDEVRYEVQVGESFAARAGNTATHLLGTEGVDSVVLVEPTAAFLSREILGTITMKLRTREAVIGPATRGRIALVGLREPIDFEAAFEPPAIETMVTRADDADLEIDFTELIPVVESPSDLLTAVTMVRARVRAGRNVPPQLAAFVAEHGLTARSDDGSLAVRADPDS